MTCAIFLPSSGSAYSSSSCAANFSATSLRVAESSSPGIAATADCCGPGEGGSSASASAQASINTVTLATRAARSRKALGGTKLIRCSTFQISRQTCRRDGHPYASQAQRHDSRCVVAIEAQTHARHALLEEFVRRERQKPVSGTPPTVVEPQAAAVRNYLDRRHARLSRLTVAGRLRSIFARKCPQRLRR